jgi:hypothetical protein
MKLRILSVIILSAFTSAGFGQSLQVAGGDSLLITQDLNPLEAPAAQVYIRNISGQFKTVKVTKEVLSLKAGHDAYFCWGGTCFSPTTMVSPNDIPIDADVVDSSFKGYVMPNGIEGTTEVRYCFQVNDNPSDQTCFRVRHAFGTTSVIPDEPSERLSSVQAVYDAGSQTIYVDVVGGKIDVMNMLGQQVSLSFRYNGGGMSADASTLKTGYYFLFGRNEKGPWSARVVVNKQ